MYNGLIKYYPTLKREFTADWCRGVKSRKLLQFDFCIREKAVIIELDGGDDEEEDANIDEEDDANNDDDDDFSHKIIKKQELSPYLNKIMKRCKDIQRNNELDNDYNDDIDDNDISFDGLDELCPDLTYTL